MNLKILKFINNLDVGEIILNSVDKDGNYQGLDLKMQRICQTK